MTLHVPADYNHTLTTLSGCNTGQTDTRLSDSVLTKQGHEKKIPPAARYITIIRGEIFGHHQTGIAQRIYKLAVF